jgi:hypothetical protein
MDCHPELVYPEQRGSEGLLNSNSMFNFNAMKLNHHYTVYIVKEGFK